MKLTPLYEVKLIVDGKQHFYTMGEDETYFPGVTTCLQQINKPALIPWAVKACSDNIKDYLKQHAVNRILTDQEVEQACLEGKNIYKKKASDAADIGSRVHKACDDIIRGTYKDEVLMGAGRYGADIAAGVQGFLDWKASNSLTIELGDTKIGSKVFGYGGSLDFVAFQGSEPIIFDIKTTKKRKDADHGIYPEYAYQLAAYAQAFHETYGLEVKNVYALWLNKEKPEFKPVKISNLSEAFQGFLAALKLYKLNKYQLFE